MGLKPESIKVDPAVWLGHYRVLNDIEFQLSQLARQQQLLRLKRAEARRLARHHGCDVDAMDTLRTIEKLPTQRKTKRYIHLQTYYRWHNLDDALLHVTDRKKHKLWKIGIEGRDAALIAGKAPGDNPYNEGTEDWKHWDLGFRSVNEPSEERYGATPPVPTHKKNGHLIWKTRKKRGRPKGVGNKLKGGQVAARLRAADRRARLPGIGEVSGHVTGRRP